MANANDRYQSLVTKVESEYTTEIVNLATLGAPETVVQYETMISSDPAQNFDPLRLALLSNGTLLGGYPDAFGDPATQRMLPVNVSAGPAINFTAFSTSDDARIYGLSGDEILEYGFFGNLSDHR
jgi:hypothetical protein